jgi:hypothetical protein
MRVAVYHGIRDVHIMEWPMPPRRSCQLIPPTGVGERLWIEPAYPRGAGLSTLVRRVVLRPCR